MRVNKTVIIILVIAMLLSMGSMGALAESNDIATIIDVGFIRSAEFTRNNSGEFVFTRTSTDSAFRLFASHSQYTQEQMVITPLTESDERQIAEYVLAIRASGGGSKEVFSSLTGAVVAYLTINYQYGTTNGVSTIALTSVSGKYTTVGQAAVTGQSVTFGQNGRAPSGTVSGQNKTVAVGTNTSWSESIPSDWKPINEGDGSYQVLGANSTVYFIAGGSQGGTSSQVSLTNNYNFS